MLSLLRLSFVGMFAFGFIPTALAAEGPCQSDIAKFCPNMKAGGGKIAACLQQHEAELSPQCRDKRAKRQDASGQELLGNCRDDVQKLCKDAPAAVRGKIECLKQHEGKLSAACSKELQKRSGKKK